MKIIDNILYIEYPEMVNAGINERTTRRMTTINDPSDERKILISFESMKGIYQEMVIHKYGNPYEYIANISIKQYLNTNYEARTFYRGYKLADGRSLPEQYITKYTHAAEWLDLIRRFTEKGTKTLLAKLGLNREQFWNAVIELIKTEGIDLPSSYDALNSKRKKYITEGFECIISRKFCNQTARKVLDGDPLTVLIEMLSHQHQFDANYVMLNYNKWAVANNYEPITASLVNQYHNQYKIDISLPRHGASVWHNKFGKVIHRERPSAPLLLVNADDNTLDLYFINGKNKYHRYVLYMVIDAYNDYPLGWAIGDTPTKELIRQAFVNAKNHVKELTGTPEHYMWRQIVTDHWGLNGDLRDFYENQAHFTPPALKNARGKYIEQSFGHIWHEKLKQYKNYAGHNIRAKQQLNPDMMKTTNFPDVSTALDQIQHFVEQLRNHTNKDGITRKEQWLQGFANCPENKKRVISNEELILFLGKAHESMNTITNNGLITTLLGQKLTYDVPEEAYYNHVGDTMQVYYYESDLSKILLCNSDKSVKILCEADVKTKSCLADMEPEDRLLIKNKQDEQRRISQKTIDGMNDRRASLERLKINAESLLQAGVYVKELRQPAERLAAATMDIYSLDEGNETFEIIEE